MFGELSDMCLGNLIVREKRLKKGKPKVSSQLVVGLINNQLSKRKNNHKHAKNENWSKCFWYLPLKA